MTQVVSRQVARNAIYGGVARFLTLTVGLVMTPYILTRLGGERFAVWALVGVVVGAFGLLDLSLKVGFVKHLSEAMASRDRQGMSAIVTTGFVSYLCFSLLVAIAFVAMRRPLLVALDIPVNLHAEASDVFAIGLMSFLIGAAFSVFPAICDAKQRMDVTHGLGLASLGITVVATIAALEKGLGLRGVALAQLLGVIFFHSTAVGASRWLEQGWRLGAFDRSWFRRLFRFGAMLHVSTACGIVNRQFDKLLLSNWSGLPAVTSYEIAARLAASTGSFQPYLAAALLPAASHLDTLGRHRELADLYVRASRYLFIFGVPPFVFLAANARTLMVAWLGHPEPLAAAVLLTLAGGYLINSMSNGMAFVCQGMDRPDLQARQSSLQLVVNIVASVVLLRLVGPLGAPLGTSMALLLGAVYFARRFHPLLDLSTLTLLRQVAWVPLLASLIGAGAGLLAASGLDYHDRPGAILVLAVHGLVFAAIYGAVCAWTGHLRFDELKRLVSALRLRQDDTA